jgi:hypothetical protein
VANKKDKRVTEGTEALRNVFTDVFMSMPEIVNNPDADPKEIITNFLEKSGKSIFRTAVRTGKKPYGEYLKYKDATQDLAEKVTAEISKFTNLSSESIEKIGAAAAAGIKLLQKGELKVSPQTVTFNGDDVVVKAGGYVNPKEGVYIADLAGKIEDPFGVKGLDLTTRARVGLERGTPSFRDASVGASYKVGDDSSIYGEVSPERITVGGRLTFKKGGKVKKKRKTKNYTKGCVVRAAKY